MWLPRKKKNQPPLEKLSTVWRLQHDTYFFFGIFFPNLEKTDLKTVVGSFFPNLEKIEKYQKISKKTFLEILKTKLSNLEKSKSWPDFPNLEKNIIL